jgi:tRNA/rRNA methyltransferase
MAATQAAVSTMIWQDRLRIVLVRARNSLNIGAAARAMLNFGFSRLWLVRPYDVAFRAARSAVGAAEVLEKACVTNDLSEALGDASLVVGTSGVDSRSRHHVQRSLPEGSHAIRTHLESRPAALVFGSEKHGLTNHDLSFCDWVVSIPTHENCPSMNLGQAVAVCCYELARHAKTVPALQTPATATAEQRHRIVETLLPILEQSGFLRPVGRESQAEKIRRLVGRLRLAPDDARMVQAMIRQIEWKLDHP